MSSKNGLIYKKIKQKNEVFQEVQEKLVIVLLQESKINKKCLKAMYIS
jgi:hypothetical protein